MKRGDLGLLAIAVVAVSVSGPLIREADAPALSIAAWRNVLAVAVLVAVVLARPAHRAAARAVGPRDRKLTGLAGVLLAGHFATWVPSLALTTVASSVALVCTQPVWTALLARVRGEPVTRTAWWGIGLALAGVVVLSGVDLSVSGRALAGDGLALAGGVLAAGYVTAGAEVRAAVPNPVYTLGCYAVAAVALVLLAGGTGQALSGYSARTWLVLAGLAAGPQLLGHSVFNRLLPSVGTLVVSVSVLLEVLGASLLAWWWQSETPPAAAVPAAALLVGGVFLVIRARVVTSPIEPP